MEWGKNVVNIKYLTKAPSIPPSVVEFLIQYHLGSSGIVILLLKISMIIWPNDNALNDTKIGSQLVEYFWGWTSIKGSIESQTKILFRSKIHIYVDSILDNRTHA